MSICKTCGLDHSICARVTSSILTSKDSVANQPQTTNQAAKVHRGKTFIGSSILEKDAAKEIDKRIPLPRYLRYHSSLPSFVKSEEKYKWHKTEAGEFVYIPDMYDSHLARLYERWNTQEFAVALMEKLIAQGWSPSTYVKETPLNWKRFLYEYFPSFYVVEQEMAQRKLGPFRIKLNSLKDAQDYLIGF